MHFPTKQNYTIKETEHVLLNRLGTSHDPRIVMKQASEVLSEYLKDKQEIPDEGIDASVHIKVDRALSLLNLDNHHLLLQTVGERYKGFLLEMCRQITEEYSCATASQKALAQMAASAYVRSLEYGDKLNGQIGINWHDKALNAYTAILSKEVDRAYRQFVSAMTLLKQMKAPELSVNIKTNTAFVAQNQQINANKHGKHTDPQNLTS